MDSLVVTKNYQQVLALAFAVSEINENPQILPNVSLGFHISESYFSPRRVYHIAMEFFFTRYRFIPNYKCGLKNNLVAVFGGLGYETSRYLFDILNIYKLPQFSHGDFAPVLRGEPHVSYLYKMVPSDTHQYIGIIQLLLYFKWMWVGLMTTENDSGESFVKNIITMFYDYGICPAFTKKMSKLTFFDELLNVGARWNTIFVEIMESNANAIVVYGDTEAMLIFKLLLHGGETDSGKAFYKVWIMAAQLDLTAVSMHRDWDIETFHGALAFTAHSQDVPGFQHFLQNRRPHLAKDDDFIQEFWEQAFSCSFPNLDGNEEILKTCTGEEKLQSLPGPLFEMRMTGHSYSVYNAVYVLANALHVVYSSMYKSRIIMSTGKLKHENMKPWKLHLILRNLSFNNSAGETVFLNAKGELTMGFDITNVITFPNNSFVRVKVGRMNPWAPPGKEFSIDKDIIMWPRIYNQVIPLSLCNDHCHPGYQKKKKEGQAFCCYDCVQCLYGKISQETGTFIKHRDTPIVKANNRNLTYTLLVSLLFCFLSSLLFIGLKKTLMPLSCSRSAKTKNYQHALALAFAVKEINENPKLLPNISLGFHIYDNYLSARMTYQNTLKLLSAQNRIVSNYICDRHYNLISVIGGHTSETSLQMATILDTYKIPQIAYSVLAPVTNVKEKLPSFYRMVPCEKLQYTGIILLLLYFHWIWVGIIASDDDKGETFVQTLLPMLSQYEICTAVIERTQTLADALESSQPLQSIFAAAASLSKSTVKVYIVNADFKTISCLKWLIYAYETSDGIMQISTGKMWIMTAHWDFSSETFHRDFEISVFHGALSLASHSNDVLGFTKFMQQLCPIFPKGDGFIRIFWEQAFNCLFSDSKEAKENNICTGEEKLETLPATIFEMSMTAQSYSIYNAVYAITHALDKMLSSSIPTQKATANRSRWDPQTLHSWMLHFFLKNISFNNSAGDTVSFDENGELAGGFDIINWVTFPNKSFLRRNVGRIDQQALLGPKFTMNEEAITWHKSFNQVRYEYGF
ncbi:hypothetical protein JD844_001681 [Phrynosoma platyrhinos]|uniref:G-protein coupled receptors family 3 profile domain-containing protein n=1 Tax=Phrynosoma platyrhinos TaxID=52577 RepID=A0ABQ7TAZ1_PHRPL|nr:hypothetical protein JD844_001681 [Phrynosoma platyrhinos]